MTLPFQGRQGHFVPADHKDGDAYNIIYKLFTHAIVVCRADAALTILRLWTIIKTQGDACCEQAPPRGETPTVATT